jgi:hypothetical protein
MTIPTPFLPYHCPTLLGEMAEENERSLQHEIMFRLKLAMRAEEGWKGHE